MKGLTRPCADFAESKDVDAKAIISQHRACAKTDFYGSFDFWEVAGFSRQRGRVRFPHGSFGGFMVRSDMYTVLFRPQQQRIGQTPLPKTIFWPFLRIFLFGARLGLYGPINYSGQRFFPIGDFTHEAIIDRLAGRTFGGYWLFGTIRHNNQYAIKYRHCPTNTRNCRSRFRPR